MNIVWKLLRQNISKPQLFGFFFANLIGLSIVLLSIQFYKDIDPIFSEKDNLFKDDYITITKQIGLLNTVSNKSSAFSTSEISDLKKQNFVKDVGGFTPSLFSVFAGINNSEMGIKFSTEMFFESVPNKFIDVKTENWTFRPSDRTVPIILPKNYLDLYNFGFAEANGIPKISENLISLVSLDIALYGKNGQREEMKGRVVGFSNRINTILVPESFMDWANTNLGEKNRPESSRLIVEVSNIADPNLANYFKDNGYVVSGENTTASRMSFFLKIIVGIVLAVGLLICILSFFILTLSIYLLLEKNMSKLKTLRLIGYSKAKVVRPYEYLSIGLNLIILILSLLIVFVVRNIYLASLTKLLTTTTQSSIFFMLTTGIAISFVLSILNILVIRRKVN